MIKVIGPFPAPFFWLKKERSWYITEWMMDEFVCVYTGLKLKERMAVMITYLLTTFRIQENFLIGKYYGNIGRNCSHVWKTRASSISQVFFQDLKCSGWIYTILILKKTESIPVGSSHGWKNHFYLQCRFYLVELGLPSLWYILFLVRISPLIPPIWIFEM